ncbi:EAL domain-containing protein [Ruminococcus sp.]|uniref:EAL domain-containing protein n=1 Tax=Ruminococcus sp. TaxID=41978 RepID=UPI0025D3AB33|nr:EAL domain-containing protein [Ruminococcus sp.]MBQ8965517.1 EAL domain-containing protein [Ruminococcus sp.]
MERKAKQRRLYGVVISEADQFFYGRTLYHIQKEFFAHDADVAVFSSLLTQNELRDVENSVFSLIEPSLVDGLLVFGQALNSEEALAELRRFIDHSGMPAVFVESRAEGLESVMFDNDECAELIVSHLAEVHGVKKVCYAGGPEQSGFHQNVQESFCRAFERHGIVLGEDDIFHGPDWVGDYGVVADAIIKHGLPEAVVCCSDFTAAGLLGAFCERGVNVPEELLVTGYSMNEPFKSDYVNITSIERRPENLAAEAVRRLISLVTGEEYVPAERQVSGVLCKGVSCGCERIDYSALARSAMDNMVGCRRSGFDSYYNSMSETLVSAGSMEEFLWKLDWYTRYLGNEPQGFWLCLNDGIMHVPGDRLEDYSETLSIPYSRINGTGAVPGGAGFRRRELLPAIFEPREKPAAFMFNCLHFGRVNYGYTVLSFGDTGYVYNRHFVMWLRYTAIAIDKQRRHMIYRDSVSDDQVRDPLTGLLNVRGYKNLMKQLCGDFNRPDKLMRIISVDVENLRGINSAYGYNEGDRVLQRLAMVLNNSAGEDDICVRVSGDEFFICGLIDAAVPVDEVPDNLERNLDKFNSGSTIDYGVHFYTSRVTAPVTSAEILDTLPYEANYQRTMVKENHNKKRTVIAREEGESENIGDTYDPEERKLVAKILNDNLLTYHFQPIVSAQTGDVVAYEALMRSAGDIKLSPISIINHAAAMGRLDDVEWHTMHNLFKFCHDNKEQLGERRLFINSIPSCTLPDKDFEELCHNYSDIVNKMVIEFTEQTEASREQLEKVLERRSKRGFGIAIDDYGTGYSNVNSLLTFMPNCVKIDRSLIMNIHEDKRKQHFAKNIIDYAHDYHFKVLAEGVEKAEELKTLIGMGIDLIQGYLTARPDPKLITMIRPDIRDRIKEFSRLSESARVRKTYFAVGDQEVSLRSLDFDDYTDVFVASENLTLKGTEEHSSELSVRIKDGLDCRVVLDNVNMSGENNIACITVGKGSRLTLEIVGTVVLSGPISVPEGAWLDIVGDGNLIMNAATNQSYGIGSDPLNRYGSIGIHLRGKLDMKLDGERCVGIGGGYSCDTSKIDIGCSELEIALAGKHLVCIGSTEDDTAMTIRNTRMKLSNRCVSGIAIGSGRGQVKALIENSELFYDASGDSISGICSVVLGDSSAVIRHSNVGMIMRGKNLLGIGSAQGAMSVEAENCAFDMTCEGAKAIGVGCMSADSSITLKECSGRISVSTSQGMAVMAAKGRLSIEGGSLEQLNNV